MGIIIFKKPGRYKRKKCSRNAPAFLSEAEETVVYITYQWNGIRYITCYHDTGVRKSARVLDENNEYYHYVYNIDSETDIVECEHIELQTIYWWQWWKR